MNADADADVIVTLRVPRWLVAFVSGACTHLILGALLSRLPEPKRKEERVEIALRTPPPKPPPSSPPPSSPPPRKRARQPQAPAPPPTPVVPELPPSEVPPEQRAILPVVEQGPQGVPAPPPSWRDRLAEALADSAPQTPSDVLLPSLQSLHRIANADPRLHDDENEARLQVDFGAFFRRGLEALRGHWHPDDVLERQMTVDETRRCARQDRTTRVVAVIDREGDVVDVEVKDPSGCPPLDQEAVAAFRRVARFPFPPAGLFVDGDGNPMATARYVVRFIVTFDGGVRLDWQ